MAVDIDIDFKLDKAAKKLLSGETINRATERTVEKLLDRAEDATLITQYTQTARPAKPQDSTYIRTFRLQRSSKKQVRKSGSVIEGKWEARTAYASFVIGKSAQQAAIHIGRWPPLELAINNVEVNAQKDFDREIKKEL